MPPTDEKEAQNEDEDEDGDGDGDEDGEAAAELRFPRALFSPRQMLVASLFGSVLAGVILLQANYRAMGEPRAANRTLLFGLLASAVIIPLLAVMPLVFPGIPLGIAIAFGFQKLADAAQGAAFDQHRAAGGARHLNGVVFGLTIGTAAALCFVAGFVWVTVRIFVR